LTESLISLAASASPSALIIAAVFSLKFIYNITLHLLTQYIFIFQPFIKQPLFYFIITYLCSIAMAYSFINDKCVIDTSSKAKLKSRALRTNYSLISYDIYSLYFNS